MKRGESPWADAANLIGDVRLIFDVGANVGQTSSHLALQFPEAAIYAFEPVPFSYALLKANTDPIPQVTAFSHGFSSTRASETIFVQEDSGWHSVSKNIDRGLGTTEIALNTIDAFCLERGVSHINILKTDTEGHDLAVLTGAKAMLSEARVDAVYSEVGFYREDAGHTNFCDMLVYLQQLDFQFMGLYDVDGIQYIANDVEPCYPWTNALFIRNKFVQAKYGDSYTSWLSGIRPPRAAPAT